MNNCDWKRGATCERSIYDQRTEDSSESRFLGIRRSLFGSYEKGSAGARNDVDILVDSGLRGLRFFGLLESVNSALKIPVDLIDVTQIEPDSEI